MNIAASALVAFLTIVLLPLSSALAAPFSGTDCQITQDDPICVCESAKGKHGKTFPCDDTKLGPKCTEKGGTLRRLLESENPANPMTIECSSSESGDSDSDGVADFQDNCPSVANPPPGPGNPQTDTDGDGTGDSCDICPTGFDNGTNDTDTDGVGNVCDNCPAVHNPSQGDGDGDGYGDPCDNCPSVSNPSQQNTDNDELGDACDPS